MNTFSTFQNQPRKVVIPQITITNPNFSSPALSTNSWGNYSAILSVGTTIPGWTASYSGSNSAVCAAGLVNGISGSFNNITPPYPQMCFIQMYSNSYGTATLSQPINITTAKSYTVSFYVHPRDDSGADGYNPQQQATLSLNGNSVTSTISSYTFGWIKYSFTTTIASIGNYTLSIIVSTPSPVSDSSILFTGISIV
jgi:hypothetical protein